MSGDYMKYFYSFSYSYYGSLLLELSNKIELFANFIEHISTEDRADEFIQIIDEVRVGNHGAHEILFTAASVLVRPRITKVTFAEVLDAPPPDQYIETDQLRELILIWKEKLQVRFIDEDMKH